jgi:hypothetical protein
VGNFNRIAAKPIYTKTDKKQLAAALVTLRVLVRVDGTLRPNKNPFNDAWALLRINRGDFLMAPDDREPRIVSTGRGDWIGFGKAGHDSVDELATRMTAKVINKVAADVLCGVETRIGPRWCGSTRSCLTTAMHIGCWGTAPAFFQLFGDKGTTKKLATLHHRPSARLHSAPPELAQRSPTEECFARDYGDHPKTSDLLDHTKEGHPPCLQRPGGVSRWKQLSWPGGRRRFLLGFGSPGYGVAGC